ncbi:MAG TPA: 2'-5' RNA ligase family protein [Pseudonocardiaceae bacterium]|nr:2'-5' RNA ligase family protein [Pseudonocardiaceae bacterium]
MKDFFGLGEARWRRSDGRLHCYIVPPAPVRELAAQYQQVMRQHEIVSVQPPEWLHMTVQSIDRHRGEIDDGVVTELAEVLTARMTAIAPFPVTVGPAMVGVHVVSLFVPPPATALRKLMITTRDAVAEVLGGDAVPPISPRWAPHISLAYGRAAGSSDPLIRAVKDAWLAPVTFSVDAMHLVLAEPRDGGYVWDTLQTLPLTGQAT